MAIKLTTYYAGNSVPNLPGSNTFHSTDLFRIYEATPGYRPILIVATCEGRVVSKLLAVVRRGTRSWFPIHAKRCEVYGEGEYFDPQIDREVLFSEMLQRLTDEALRDCFLIEFRNLSNALWGYKSFKSQGYFAINWLRVYNSLHSSDKVEERFSASRIRQIKKGLQNGAELAEAHTPQDVEEFTQMLRRNYSLKIRRHFPNPVFFHQLQQRLGSPRREKIFLVRYKGRVIGGSACIYSDTTAYLWFSGGMRKTYALQYPGILAVWKAMTDAKSCGYEHLEFMDVGLPYHAHGYREFVLRFGGKQISTRRWFQFRWKWLNRVLRYFYK